MNTDQPMSREQMEELLSEFNPIRPIVLAHDAALRAENERLTEQLRLCNIDQLQAEQQLAAMQEDRDTQWIAATDKVKDLKQQLAAVTQDKQDSQTANAALREELEQLRADYRSEQRMSEDFEQQLAAMQKEWDDDVEDLVSRCACQWDRTNDGEGKPDPIVECVYHLEFKEQLAAMTQARDAAYKQGIDDAHRCEQRHATIEIDALEQQLAASEALCKALEEDLRISLYNDDRKEML